MKARSQAKPKRFRRYDSTGLSGPWEALPRPQLRHHLVGGKWIALALVALLVIGAILYLWLSDTFYVTRLSITGNVLTPAQEIAQISDIGGQHMLWVNHAAASERIANGIPSVKSARVDCQLPNRCAIKVQERQPSVAWRFGGAVTWIAEDGMAFAAHRDTDLPLITIEAAQGPALLPGKEADQRIVTAAVAVAKAIPNVRQYKFTVEHGLEFQSDRGFPVYLGLGENMADRAMMWKATEAELDQLDVTPEFVDLRYPVAPYFISREQ
ncbi:MAG: FtsQ-type POTRA domain-containing protein [Chloroflexi bacterium]|nr:FtsQ-type POTRA domain-containing protein [Chloroflexota bacterium]